MTKENKPLSPTILERESKKKVTLLVGGGVVVITALAMFFTGGDVITFAPEEPKMVNTAPPDLSKQLNLRLQGDLNQTREELAAERARNEATAKANAKAIAELRQMMEQQQQARSLAEQAGSSQPPEADAAMDSSSARANSPVPPPPGAQRGEYKAPPIKGTVTPPPPVQRGTYNTLGGVPPLANGGETLSERSNQPIILEGDQVIGAESDEDGIPYQERSEKNKYAGFLPAGSFADVVLLSGVDAGASEYTRTNPQPIFMRVQSDAILPGDAKYGLATCFVGGTAYGDLSSERANIQLTRLSCVDKKRKLMLEAPITGYVSDADGKQGLRGKVVRRNGAIMAKAVLAGFASGATELLSAAGQTQTLTGSGMVTQIDPTTLTQSGLYTGAGKAAEILAEMYIKEAKSIFPVIEIPNGRKASITVTVGSALEWQPYSGQYRIIKVPDVK